ncbi:kinase-like domain-containing protein [Sporodiniella umbellata]|nr:kinase-like domain-containing protein [Sporodiniella umbellata]
MTDVEKEKIKLTKYQLEYEKIKEEQKIKYEKRKEREKRWREQSERDEREGCKNYEKLSKIGEGTYGVVFKANDKKTNSLVALKKIRLNLMEGVPTTIIREIAILKELKHKNVVSLLDMEQKDTLIYLAFEYADVDLRRYMDHVGRAGLTLGHMRSFMHQLLSGLHYCHSQRILHRDLKPQNLLIDKNGRLCIADLGLSRVFVVPMRTYTHQVITLWYRAPEILLGSQQYSTAVDMWSVGCIFAEMLTLQPLFPGDSQIDQMLRIFRLLGTPTEDMWPGVTALADYNSNFPIWATRSFPERLKKYPKYQEVDESAIDLLQALLTYNPVSRISAIRAEEHPFFFEDHSLLEPID